mmetsp:Transcript_71944/g.203940  ORF Transcript_71944/g.203940 Transcript_71944/m.203940 type:complete len:453 (+) Transcript_71944:1743-3101(+)
MEGATVLDVEVNDLLLADHNVVAEVDIVGVERRDHLLGGAEQRHHDRASLAKHRDLSNDILVHRRPEAHVNGAGHASAHAARFLVRYLEEITNRVGQVENFERVEREGDVGEDEAVVVLLPDVEVLERDLLRLRHERRSVKCLARGHLGLPLHHPGSLRRLHACARVHLEFGLRSRGHERPRFALRAARARGRGRARRRCRVSIGLCRGELGLEHRRAHSRRLGRYRLHDAPHSDRAALIAALARSTVQVGQLGWRRGHEAVVLPKVVLVHGRMLRLVPHHIDDVIQQLARLARVMAQTERVVTDRGDLRRLERPHPAPRGVDEVDFVRCFGDEDLAVALLRRVAPQRVLKLLLVRSVLPLDLLLHLSVLVIFQDPFGHRLLFPFHISHHALLLVARGRVDLALAEGLVRILTLRHEGVEVRRMVRFLGRTCAVVALVGAFELHEGLVGVLL